MQSFTYGGTASPPGSVSHALSTDRTSLTLLFDALNVSMGPGIPSTENRKNSQLNIGLAYPVGWKYSIARLVFRGYVSASAGLTAEHKGIYYFQGDTKQASASASIVGPVAQDYLFSAPIPDANLVWAPCGTVVPVNLNLQARLMGTGTGKLTGDSIDRKFAVILSLIWKPC